MTGERRRDRQIGQPEKPNPIGLRAENVSTTKHGRSLSNFRGQGRTEILCRAFIGRNVAPFDVEAE